MSKKKSRPIEVGGRNYRYMVKAFGEDHDIWAEATIQDVETGETQKGRRRPNEAFAHPSMKPSDVREIILAKFPEHAT